MNAERALKAIQSFQGAVFQAHHPRHMWCGCIDGREAGGKHFHFEDDAIPNPEISASFPPFERLPRNMRAKFSFGKLKEVSVILLSGHSDCGGAQTAIAHPDYKTAPNEEIADVVFTLANTGADLPRLKEAFMFACEGNAAFAANLLSRHITLQSLSNISGYPDVNRLIVERKMDVIPLYHAMKRGTGERSHLERYDVDRKLWIKTSEDAITNMCERPHGCTACQSCHDTIEKSLVWSYAEAAMPNGQIIGIEVPFHIARLLEQRREFYQPHLHHLRTVQHSAQRHFLMSQERN